LRRTCLLKQVTEGNIKGQIEVTRRQRRRKKKHYTKTRIDVSLQVKDETPAYKLVIACNNFNVIEARVQVFTETTLL
jgi:hypothetical protein